MWGSPWAAARWVDPRTCSPHVKRLCRGFNWVQSHRPCRCSQRHIIISRLYPWSSLWEQKKQVEPICQGQGRGWGASDRLGPAHRSAGGHVFCMTSPNLPDTCTHTDSPPRGEFPLYSEGSDKGWIFTEWQRIFFVPSSKSAQFENQVQSV